jgi:hypothetical protein
MVDQLTLNLGNLQDILQQELTLWASAMTMDSWHLICVGPTLAMGAHGIAQLIKNRRRGRRLCSLVLLLIASLLR